MQNLLKQPTQQVSSRPMPFPNAFSSPFNPISDPSHPDPMGDVQLHVTSRGGLKPQFSRGFSDSERVSPVGKDSFGFRDCWSSGSNRNSPHSDSLAHSGDDSGFDNASLDDDLDLDPLIFNQIASLRLETWFNRIKPG